MCFKTADLANTALKNGYYFQEQEASAHGDAGLSNEDEFFASFSKNYDSMRDKDDKSTLV